MTSQPQISFSDLVDIPHNDLIGQIELDRANELLASGYSYDQVFDLIEGWASDFAYDQYAETTDARDFEERAYGRD